MFQHLLFSKTGLFIAVDLNIKKHPPPRWKFEKKGPSNRRLFSVVAKNKQVQRRGLTDWVSAAKKKIRHKPVNIEGILMGVWKLTPKHTSFEG